MKSQITAILNSRPQHCVPASAAKAAQIEKLTRKAQKRRKARASHNTRTPEKS